MASLDHACMLQGRVMASLAMHVDPGAERGPALSCMFIQVLSDGQPCHACFVYPIADRNCLAPGMSKDQKRKARRRNVEQKHGGDVEVPLG